jgi:tripartite-type tricarboxylate transporter receptor subunit TctC
MKHPLSAAILAAATLLVSPIAQAQAWPTQPIKFIVSQSAGGSIDIAARLIGQKLTDALGRQVVIDNRAGANGMIAGEAAARAQPDGYTFLMTSPSTLTIIGSTTVSAKSAAMAASTALPPESMISAPAAEASG